MSEKQAKRLRQAEGRMEALENVFAGCLAQVEDQGARLTACEAAINWTRSYELELKNTALEHTRQDLKRARKRTRVLEERLWTWKAAAITAIVIAAMALIAVITL